MAVVSVDKILFWFLADWVLYLPTQKCFSSNNLGSSCNVFKMDNEFLAASPLVSWYPPKTETSTRPPSAYPLDKAANVWGKILFHFVLNMVRKLTNIRTIIYNLPSSSNIISIPSLWAELSSPNCQQQKLSKCPTDTTPVTLCRITTMWQVSAACDPEKDILCCLSNKSWIENIF